MRKFSFLFLLFPAALFAQDQKQQQQPAQDDNTVTMTGLQGLLRTQLTITPAWNVSGKAGNNSGEISGGRTNVYLHGTLEYYFSDHISVRSDAFYFVNKSKDPGGMKHNHSLEVGASWHLLKSATIDPFVGVCTGFSIVQINPVNIENGSHVVWENYPVSAHVDPIWAPRVGVNFFGQHVFHFFIEAQYLMGNYRPPVGPILSLNEVRVSAGLGWNWVITHKVAIVRPGI